MRVMFIAAIALSSACAVGAQPLLTAYRADDPPRIDGALNDPCWQSACTTSPFILATRPALPEEQTIARVCFDDERLYIAVEARESALEPALNMLEMVRAEQTGRDAAGRVRQFAEERRVREGVITLRASSR